MNLISLENITKSYGDKELYKNISLGINEGQKIGFIGINGTGKSTLLKIIAGIEKADSGNVIKRNNINIEYLSQNTDFNQDITVIEQIFRGDTPIIKTVREYEEIITELSYKPEDTVLQKRFNELSIKMDSLNAWNVESEAKSILTKLGINEFHEKVKNLSGGQKKRIALAGALITPSDLLILDEPTNHLDDDTISWLEAYLNGRKSAVIMITHDRYFLDRVANEIIELYNGNLYNYEGNYSAYLEKKIERLNLLSAIEDKRQNLIRRELKWIKRGAKARSTKQKARIERFDLLTNEEVDIPNEKIEISVANSRLGKKIIELYNIKKSYGNKKIIDDFSYIISKSDRIGIVGPNGRGKTTLLKIISGETKQDSGIVEIGETVKIGFFSQEFAIPNESLRVIDYIKETAEYISTSDGSLISASEMLENFLFSGSMQYSFISKLSGGEKRRLYLLKVLMEAPNVLLLDEPTNDLDIETLTIVEQYIEQFSGTVIAVSHDRYFLDKIANKIFSFEGEGKILEHTGNYSDYANFCEQTIKKTEVIKEKAEKQNGYNKSKEKTLKFSFKEQKEFEEIDENINKTEKLIEEVEKDILDAVSDYVLLQSLMDKKIELEEKLNYYMERWVYLNELDEKIKNKQ